MSISNLNTQASIESVGFRGSISGDPSTPTEYLRTCHIFQQNGIYYRVTLTYANQLQALSKGDWQNQIEAQARNYVSALDTSRQGFESASIDLSTRSVKVVMPNAGTTREETIAADSAAPNDAPVIAATNHLRQLFDAHLIQCYPAIRITHRDEPERPIHRPDLRSVETNPPRRRPRPRRRVLN